MDSNYTITVTFTDLRNDCMPVTTQAWINMIHSLDQTNWEYVDQFLYKNWGAQAQIHHDINCIRMKFPTQDQQMAWQLTYS